MGYLYECVYVDYLYVYLFVEYGLSTFYLYTHIMLFLMKIEPRW